MVRTLKTQFLLIINNRLLKMQAIGMLLCLPMLILFLFSSLEHQSIQYAEDVARQSEYAQEDIEWMKRTYDASLQEKHTREIQLDSMVVQKAEYFAKGQYVSYLQEAVNSWKLYFSLQKVRGYNITESQFPALHYGTNMAFDDVKRSTLNSNFARQRVAIFEGMLASTKEVTINELVGITARGQFYRWLGHAGPEVLYLPLFFLLTLLFSSPIFLDDKQHESLLEVKPLSHLKYLLDKIISYWLLISGFEIFLLAIILFAISSRFGAGDWTLDILTFVGQEEVQISSMEFYGKAVLFFLLINFFLITCLASCNKIFSNKPLTVCLSGLVLFLEPLLRFLQINFLGQDLLPSYYISFGPVLHGVKDYFFYRGDFSVEKGWIVLSLWTLVLFTMMYLSVLVRERFRQERGRIWG